MFRINASVGVRSLICGLRPALQPRAYFICFLKKYPMFSITGNEIEVMTLPRICIINHASTPSPTNCVFKLMARYYTGFGWLFYSDLFSSLPLLQSPSLTLFLPISFFHSLLLSCWTRVSCYFNSFVLFLTLH